MGGRLQMPEMWTHKALQGRDAIFPPVYLLPLRRIADGQHPVPQGQVRPAQGVLHRILRLDQQEGHHLHGARAQAFPQAKDLLGVQAQGHEGDEKFGRTTL